MPVVVTQSLVALELDLQEGATTPLHVHREDESFRLLRGSLLVHVDGKPAELRAGDVLTAPAGVPHAITGGRGGARVVVSSLVSSAERYADFQRAVAIPDDLPETAHDRALVAALGHANGIVVLGRPGELDVAEGSP